MHSGDYSDTECSMHEAKRQNDTSFNCSPAVSSLTAQNDEWGQSSSRHNKRKQQQSDVEDKSKKSRSDTVNHSSDKENENVNEAKYVVYIRGQTSKLTSCNPLSVCRDIEKTFGPVQKVERRGISLKITCNSVKQKQNVLACSMLGSINIIASLPNSEVRRQKEAERQKVQRVVICGVPHEINDASIQETTGAAEVRRIFKLDASRNKIPTSAVVLGFDCTPEETPSRVHLGYLTFKTRIYIPLVTRCYKCQKFGHTAVHCRKESDTCPVCVGPHKYADCTNMDNRKCANCGGSHSAGYRDCPK